MLCIYSLRYSQTSKVNLENGETGDGTHCRHNSSEIEMTIEGNDAGNRKTNPNQ